MGDNRKDACIPAPCLRPIVGAGTPAMDVWRASPYVGSDGRCSPRLHVVQGPAMSSATARTAAASRNTLELTTGFVVIVLLIALLAVAMFGRHHANGGYELNASFNQIDGLDVGSDVRLAGITVGHVTAERVDPHGFRAQVTFTVRDGLALPDDSAAIITSDSLLGGKYIALSPGGDTSMLKPGGTMGQTQGSISLEQLLSKFIFSVTDTLSKSKSGTGGGNGGP